MKIKKAAISATGLGTRMLTAIWRAKSFVGQENFPVLLGDDIMRSDIPVTR